MRNKKTRKTPYGTDESMNIEADQPSSRSTISFKDIKNLLNEEITLNDLLKGKVEEDMESDDIKSLGTLVRIQRMEYKDFVKKKNEIRDLL